MVSEVSILIPVYNYSIFPLVNELLTQARIAGNTYEIICLDDASDEQYKQANRLVASLPGVLYKELVQNIGRSAIRNKLASLARYSYLLFVDNDSGIPSKEFVYNYLQQAHPKKVILGGTVYSDQPPSRELLLHWQVGRNREQKPLKKRERQPYRHVHLNNVLVPKDIILTFPLCENLTQYGHEDTLWSKQLEQAHIPVIHIYNPVIHQGLEPCGMFLEKTEQAVENLHHLFITGQIGQGTSLIKAFLWLSERGLLPFFLVSFKFVKPFLLFNLKSKYPWLVSFDLYKLGLFTRIN